MKSKKIPYGKLCLAFVCLCVFVVAFMLGFFLWPFFLPAILAMALAGSMVLAGCGGSEFSLASEKF